jgi:hypothetical protein
MNKVILKLALERSEQNKFPRRKLDDAKEFEEQSKFTPDSF